MQFSKKSIKLLGVTIILIVLCSVLWIVCGSNATTEDARLENTSGYATTFSITDADQRTDDAETKSISLDEYEGVYKITDAGAYRFTGTLNGQLIIEAQDQMVHIILDNATIHSDLGPAIVINSATKVILTTIEGTTNNLKDSGSYPAGAEEDACVYSVCDLTINGAGVLNVNGYYEDAIHTKDILKVLGGEIFVQSKRDGLHGNDGILVSGASMSVQSERNGLHSTKTGKMPKGNIEMKDGTYSIIAGKYAISCSADLYISDCGLYAMGVLDRFKVGGISNVSEEVFANE